MTPRIYQANPTEAERRAARVAAARSATLVGCTCTFEVVVETTAERIGTPLRRRVRRTTTAEVIHENGCPALERIAHYRGLHYHEVTVQTTRSRPQP